MVAVDFSFTTIDARSSPIFQISGYPRVQASEGLGKSGRRGKERLDSSLVLNSYINTSGSLGEREIEVSITYGNTGGNIFYFV